ncbi:male sterility protein-domain-containing protein [Lentinula edodes]|uniref:male sterility protein-domain-containing protein n=1 Tax=Lentinula edodes TaxID=5353 RepID=UPI001E8C9E02|nr:male sterility protein-domain-containing protein [Lentinula edodes]KAH7877042.1 male sterility protein-domain-containing protein [Lentinula edodes]
MSRSVSQRNSSIVRRTRKFVKHENWSGGTPPAPKEVPDYNQKFTKSWNFVKVVYFVNFILHLLNRISYLQNNTFLNLDAKHPDERQLCSNTLASYGQQPRYRVYLDRRGTTECLEYLFKNEVLGTLVRLSEADRPFGIQTEVLRAVQNMVVLLDEQFLVHSATHNFDYSVTIVEAEERYQIEGASAQDILRALVAVVHRYTGDTHAVLGTPSSVLHIDLSPEDYLDSIHVTETESLNTGDLNVFLLHLHLALVIQNRTTPIGHVQSNAAKNPEKAAIITQTRTYKLKYGSLLNAANSFSNHLLEHGVQRGDVVMIYAHRSADLVLAVLGTLGAGATFSVIDPAYPPERQIVYLSVARTRAVIILQGAQDLNPVDELRGYWEKDLGGVKVCIEGVSLGKDGTVHADGSILKVNVADPGVVLGPDSIPTLSFTSGSTGVPKGVRGRHYSLTHFFPCMPTLSLGPESRFTMLSGLHTIQFKEILVFTLLFLGASLHVPPSSAIGTPGALAAWMDEQSVTVTHLTPAMGQLVTTTGVNEDITPTQKTILNLFASLLPRFTPGFTGGSFPSIPSNESFFDLGGHSILAIRLVFEMRRAFTVLKDRISLGVVYSKHGGEIMSVCGLASIVDVLRGEDLGLPMDTSVGPNAKEGNGIPDIDVDEQGKEDNHYAQDLDELISSHLAYSYPSYNASSARSLHVFLTGATGFLGAFILQQLLETQSSSSFVSHVTCLVRASSPSSAIARLRDSCASRGVWSDSWISSNRLTVLPGDLALRHFGVAFSQWERLEHEVGVVMHNGALVHWVYPYERFKAPNVMGTLTALELAGTQGRTRSMVFILGCCVLEMDDLETARRGLRTGYGQIKWVAEKLLFEAGKRGLSGYIIRPGYVVGESKGGVTNTDDFVWRMVKGCVQLGSIPDMSNGVNMVPVDRVAMCCVSAVTASLIPSDNASSEKSGPGGNMSVMHVTARPLPTFNDLFTALKIYGWAVEKTEYLQWREVEEDNALFPFLHFVLDDLPTSTKAPMLDDRNAVAVVERGRISEYDPPNTIDEKLMGRYLAWLVRAGLLPPPQDGQGGQNLPELEGGVTTAAGRSGI